MTINQLKEVFRILKNKGFTKGDVADNLSIGQSYISKMLNGSKPISSSFLEALKYKYGEHLTTLAMDTNLILRTNFKSVRTNYSNNLKFCEKLQISEDEIWTFEIGEINFPLETINALQDLMQEMRYPADAIENIHTIYIDQNFRFNSKESVDVSISRNKPKLKK